jgi:hypothetical protein
MQRQRLGKASVKSQSKRNNAQSISGYGCPTPLRMLDITGPLPDKWAPDCNTLQLAGCSNSKWDVVMESQSMFQKAAVAAFSERRRWA